LHLSSYVNIEKAPILLRPEMDRRSSQDRRGFNDKNFKGPERRSGKDYRSGEDRRKYKSMRSNSNTLHVFIWKYIYISWILLYL